LVLGIAALIAICACSSAPANGPVTSAGAKRPLLIGNCAKPRFEPRSVIIACGDAGLVANDLTWSSWGRKTAQGAGTGVLKTCDPNCASGGTVSGPIELTLSKPRKCSSGKRLFSKLRYAWVGSPPSPGAPPSGTQPRGCKLAGI
jgi:hypothetical protein